MVKARIVSAFVIEVSGLDLSIASKQTWRAAIDEMGRDLQERISESFANERVAGNSQLKTNTPEWNARKAQLGLDSRRGHATGLLQSALDGPRLFVISAIRRGKARIRFLEARLHGRVSYSEFYEDKKVRRAGILVVAKSWVEDAVKIVRRVEVQANMRANRARGRRRRRA